MKKAVCLLSGGLDSSVAAAVAKSEGYELYTLTIDYGQTHARELEAASKIADWLGVHRHVCISTDLRSFGGRALWAM